MPNLLNHCQTALLCIGIKRSFILPNRLSVKSYPVLLNEILPVRDTQGAGPGEFKEFTGQLYEMKENDRLKITGKEDCRTTRRYSYLTSQRAFTVLLDCRVIYSPAGK